MQQARSKLFVASHAGKLWAFGGRCSEGEHTSVEVYDPEVDVWSEVQIALETVDGGVIGCTYSSKYFK